jgi:hypothetical protein
MSLFPFLFENRDPALQFHSSLSDRASIMAFSYDIVWQSLSSDFETLERQSLLGSVPRSLLRSGAGILPLRIPRSLLRGGSLLFREFCRGNDATASSFCFGLHVIPGRFLWGDGVICEPERPNSNQYCGQGYQRRFPVLHEIPTGLQLLFTLEL